MRIMIRFTDDIVLLMKRGEHTEWTGQIIKRDIWDKIINTRPN